ncbi:MAG: aminomethyl-transferring glycine dehydrogenase subunit GcvPA [Spirochaetales bacterium]
MAYIGNTDDDRQQMLQRIGVESIRDLFADVPAEFRFPEIELPPAQTELEILREIDELAAKNAAGDGILSFQGAGAYDHFIPAIIPFLAGRGEFATAYTPYQAEASQGTVQTIFEYQSMVANLLGMEVVNASHYDGSTAVAEAGIMAVRATKGRDRVAVSGTLHPEYLQVLKTYLKPQGIGVTTVGIPNAPGDTGPTAEQLIEAIDDRTACLIVQNPDFFGSVHDYRELAADVHARGALLVIHTDPIASALFRSPGALGADIATGEGQPLGIPVSYGGPYLGLFGAKKSLVRKMPGRLAGETTDAVGKRGYVLTLNTREQHIRREKATSNICTNQGLMALRAAIYLAAMGPAGLREVAELCYQKVSYAAKALGGQPGCEVVTAPGAYPFKEFVLKAAVPAREVIARGVSAGIIPGVALDRYYPNRTNEMIIAVTETATKKSIDHLVTTVAEAVREIAGERREVIR